MSSRAKEIATTILDQLGGSQFTAMTGSYQFVCHDNWIRMRLRRNTARAKWLKIKLNSMDTYDMEFLKENKDKDGAVVVVEHNGVYGDMLRPLFEETTGLYTKLF